ncbi:MAG: hypothetical protein FWF02_01340 [Micrococcales bacterium]|nr:hypothetical protein [Micrococcales bacterium]MCL2666338.1 hypothetical protein [Micrococcales bacterium]
MNVADAPEWLVPAFTRSVFAAGATASTDEIHAAAVRLLRRWSVPHRRFHTVRHLLDVLARVDELDQETYDQELVRLGAWYHGAVFDTQILTGSTFGCEDEAPSAALAVIELLGLGVSETRARRVGDLVAALVRHDPDPTDLDATVLCDADLGVLATEPQKYRTYLRNVREEYLDVPDAEFFVARHAIITGLLARKSIYRSPGARPWEEVARENLQAELQRVNRELSRIEEPATA